MENQNTRAQAVRQTQGFIADAKVYLNEERVTAHAPATGQHEN